MSHRTLNQPDQHGRLWEAAGAGSPAPSCGVWLSARASIGTSRYTQKKQALIQTWPLGAWLYFLLTVYCLVRVFPRPFISQNAGHLTGEQRGEGNAMDFEFISPWDATLGLPLNKLLEKLLNLLELCCPI